MELVKKMKSKIVTGITFICAVGLLNASMALAFTPTVVIKQPVRPGPANAFNVAPHTPDFFGTTYG